jgi:copper chaperone CopZ
METLDPSDPHDLRNTEEAAIETALLEIEGAQKGDSVAKAVAVLKGVKGVREVHGENASGIVTVKFDARLTHIPALHDALLEGGYHPGASAD